MKFAPEYVTYVLNENFEDAKALLLSPLMAIHYAHLVMLTAQGIVSATDARALREALDGISQDEIRRVKYDGTCEDLFFYIERLIVAACGDEVAGRLHTARSRNDIDMTMYRMRQRELILGLLAATLRAAPLAPRPRRPPSRHDLRRPHAHAAGAADHRRALPAGGRRTAGARRIAAEGRLRSHERQPARRLRDHRHRLPDRSAAHLGAARVLRADRQYLRQHRDGRLPAREHVGGGGAAGRPRPLRAGPAAVGHRRSSTTSASATASCRAAASCRRSATRSRSSTRARSAARRSDRRRRSS